MKFSEILTKVAIVVAGIYLANAAEMPTALAVILTLAALALSVTRDQYIARMKRPRWMPTYGVLCLICIALVVPLAFFMNSLAPKTVIPPVLVTSLVLSLALFGKLACMFAEWVSGLTGKYITDPLIDAVAGQYGERPFVPPPNWQYTCPQCCARVEHAVDVCWNCNYGGN